MRTSLHTAPSLDSVELLRHVTKELLALAATDLFPGTLLLGGEVSDTGFFYDFRFPDKILPLFSERELERIEDRMLQLVVADLPIKSIEMMREVAISFLDYQGQPLMAETAASASSNIVSL